MRGQGLMEGAAVVTAMALAPTAAGAMPPQVEVTPLVVTAEAEHELFRAVTTLVADLGRTGHYTGTPPPPAIVSARCDLHEPDRERCFADAARNAAVPNAVFVIAEPDGPKMRVSCIAADIARSQQAEVSLEVANGSDGTAALQERSALSRCIIGALHAPPRA